MTDPVATVRVEVAFDPAMHSLVRDFLHVLTRLLPEPKAPAADPEPTKEDALSRIDRELEMETLSAQIGPALGAFYCREVASATVTHAETPAPSSLPPLPVIAGRLGALTDDDRAIILAHREAGAQPNGLARTLGVQPTTIHGILYTARLKRDRAEQGKPHKGRGFWSPEKRAELLKRYEDGEKRDALAKIYGATPDAVRLQLYHARKERAENQETAAPAMEALSAAAPQAEEPANAEPAREAAQVPTMATTVRTLDQHRAVAASLPKPVIVAPTPRATLAPIPKPSPAPPRKIRQDLAAEIAAFEATKGVTRIPSGEEFAAIGVPMSFTDEEDAIRWLTSHDHQVKHGPGRGRITVDGKHMPRQEFRQRAAAIAREFGMELIRKQRDQGRAA